MCIELIVETHNSLHLKAPDAPISRLLPEKGMSDLPQLIFTGAFIALVTIVPVDMFILLNAVVLILSENRPPVDILRALTSLVIIVFVDMFILLIEEVVVLSENRLPVDIYSERRDFVKVLVAAKAL